MIKEKYYITILDRLRKEIKKKCPGNLARKSVIDPNYDVENYGIKVTIIIFQQPLKLSYFNDC